MMNVLKKYPPTTRFRKALVRMLAFFTPVYSIHETTFLPAESLYPTAQRRFIDIVGATIIEPWTFSYERDDRALRKTVIYWRGVPNHAMRPENWIAKIVWNAWAMSAGATRPKIGWAGHHKSPRRVGADRVPCPLYDHDRSHSAS